MANVKTDPALLYDGLRKMILEGLPPDDRVEHTASVCLDRAMAAYVLGDTYADKFLPSDLTASLKSGFNRIFEGTDMVGTACALLDASAGNVTDIKARDAGVHYTPGTVARFICRQAISSYVLQSINAKNNRKYNTMEEVLDKASHEELYNVYFDILKPVSLFDSSCGSGIFLEAALYELYSIRRAISILTGFESGFSECQLKKDIAEHNLYGMDVEPYSIEVTAIRLMILVGGPLTPNLSCENALFYDPPGADLFDIIVGNPPYMRIKSMFSDMSKTESALRKKELAAMVRKSGLYRYQEGNLNLYKLFIERILSLLKHGGSMGLIIPSSFLNETTSEKLRKHLFKTCSVEEIVEIPERSRLFPGVNQATAILVLNHLAGGAGSFKLRLGVSASDIDAGGSSISINYEELEALTDGRMEVPLMRKPAMEWDMIRRLKDIPPFKGCDGITPVGDIYIGHVDETLDAKYISEISTGDIFVKGIHLKEYSVDLSSGGPQPRWVKKTGLIKSRPSVLSVIDQWRIIGRNTQNKACARRLKFAILPPGYVCGNSIKQIIVADKTIEPLYLLGLLNSSVLNWFFEMFCSQNNIRNYSIEVLPIVRAQSDVQVTIARLAGLIMDTKGEARTFLDRSVIDPLIFELYFIEDAPLVKSLGRLQKLCDADFIKWLMDDAYINQKLKDISADDRYNLIKEAAFRD
jgi:Alw26I/Eco31I/Esp3I family type II restriction m6 adenine DNA methyltransferase